MLVVIRHIKQDCCVFMPVVNTWTVDIEAIKHYMATTHPLCIALPHNLLVIQGLQELNSKSNGCYR